MRFGEVKSLKWGAVDLDRGLITIFDAKGSKTRTAFMTPEVKEMLNGRTKGDPESLRKPSSGCQSTYRGPTRAREGCQNQMKSNEKISLTMVSKIANLTNMNFTIEYFHARVKVEIESWPDDLLADFARMVELLMDFGPNIGMPHSRSLGGGLFELRPRGREGIGRAFYCFAIGAAHCNTSRLQEKNARNPGTSLTGGPEKNEGGPEWIR